MGKTKVLLVVALLSLAFSGLAGADYMIGDKGSEVSMLQRRLTQAGFKVDDDGVYGQLMRSECFRENGIWIRMAW